MKKLHGKICQGSLKSDRFLIGWRNATMQTEMTCESIASMWIFAGTKWVRPLYYGNTNRIWIPDAGGYRDDTRDKCKNAVSRHKRTWVQTWFHSAYPYALSKIQGTRLRQFESENPTNRVRVRDAANRLGGAEATREESKDDDRAAYENFEPRALHRKRQQPWCIIHTRNGLNTLRNEVSTANRFHSHQR